MEQTGVCKNAGSIPSVFVTIRKLQSGFGQFLQRVSSKRLLHLVIAALTRNPVLSNTCAVLSVSKRV